jgi:hypothetical protein
MNDSKRRATVAAAAASAAVYREKDRKRRLVLKVDTHEANNTEFMQTLRTMLREKGLEDRLRIETLNCFDFVYALLERPTEQFGPAIERKTVEDLSASIRDGRFREQKARMAAMDQPADKKIVLIEGQLPRVGHEEHGSHLINSKALHGAVLKAVMRGECTGTIVEGASVTAAYLVEWLVYLEHVDNPTEEMHMSYVDGVQSQVRKADFRDDNRLALMLSGFVQNVSPAVARAVVGAYPTLADLQVAYLRDPAGTRDRVAALEVDGRDKRVGPVVAGRIAEVLDVEKLRDYLGVQPTVPQTEKRKRATFAAPKQKKRKTASEPANDDDDGDNDPIES